MEIIELRCKSCAAPLAAENVVQRLAMARCGHCGAVFALDAGSQAASGVPAARGLRPKVPLPTGIRLEDWGNSLQIIRRWFSPLFLFLAFFCVFWNGFMVVWHVMALSSGAWFMSLFGLLHTAVGIGLLYFTIAGFFNSTVIRVQQGLVEVRHGPLPWPGNKSIPAHDLQQFFCREHVSHNKNGTTVTYEVHAVRKNQTREALLKGLNDAEQALYIEQELERFLRLEDRPIAGELSS